MIYRLDSYTDIGYTVIRKEDNMTEAQKRASAKYDLANTRMYTLKLNRQTDADLITLLDGCDNVQGFIKTMIRNFLANGGKSYDEK